MNNCRLVGGDPYPAGCWGVVAREVPGPGHPDYLPGNPIDTYGFYPTSAKPADPWGSKGLHAGYDDHWWKRTAGCIRTTSGAMALLRHFDEKGDPLKWLVCTWAEPWDDEGFIDPTDIINDIDDCMRHRGIPTEIRDKIETSVYNYLWQLLVGDLNFTIDYFFNSESPIPGFDQ